MAAKRDAAGGPMPYGLDRDALRGMAAIRTYTGYCNDVILRLVKEQGFPAAIIAGKWESSRHLVDEWRIGQIRLSVAKTVAEIQEA